MIRTLLAAVAVGSPLGAAAADIEETAKTEREVQRAKDDVAKKYEGKKPEELSREDRAQRAREEQAAVNQALEKRGTDAKSHEKTRIKMRQEDQRAVQDRAQAIRKKEEEDAKKPPPKEAEVQIERGFKSADELDEREGNVNPSDFDAPPTAPAKGKRKGR